MKPMIQHLKNLKETPIVSTFLKASSEVLDREGLQTEVIPCLAGIAAGIAFGHHGNPSLLNVGMKTLVFTLGLQATATLNRTGDLFDDLWRTRYPGQPISATSVLARTAIDGVLGAAMGVFYQWGVTGKETLGAAGIGAAALVGIRLVNSVKARREPITAHPV